MTLAEQSAPQNMLVTAGVHDSIMLVISHKHTAGHDQLQQCGSMHACTCVQGAAAAGGQGTAAAGVQGTAAAGMYGKVAAGLQGHLQQAYMRA